MSFPSSHTIPYLRTKRFPRLDFPELYEYRSLRDRLEAKVQRAFRRVPSLNFAVSRFCCSQDAGSFSPSKRVDAIITSPPYMRLLDYARDNRLRLWFLDTQDWRLLDRTVSPGEDKFLDLMHRCFVRWKTVLKPQHYCVLVIGDACSRSRRGNLPEAVARIATQVVGGYSQVCSCTEDIPTERRVRRGIAGSATETIVVLRNNGG